MVRALHPEWTRTLIEDVIKFSSQSVLFELQRLPEGTVVSEAPVYGKSTCWTKDADGMWVPEGVTPPDERVLTSKQLSEDCLEMWVLKEPKVFD